MEMTKGGVVSMFAPVEAVQVLWGGNAQPSDGRHDGGYGLERHRDRQGGRRGRLPMTGSV